VENTRGEKKGKKEKTIGEMGIRKNLMIQGGEREKKRKI